jgi:guanidinoacetate N-methyltransferase
MTKRLKRFPEFELSLQLKREDFIRPPRESQRSWLLNRSMNEFSHDILALDRAAGSFVEGSDQLSTEDRTQADLDDLDIMEDWQIPIMQAMAQCLARVPGNVLEIGFGRGVAADMIQECGVKSHTIIECNDSIVERFKHWRGNYPSSEIHMVHGLWQDVLDRLPKYDGIFFHTYPLNESDYLEQIAGSITFAEHFFPHAAAHLVDGGVFTYLSNEMDSLSRQHQRLLFQYFSSIEISMIRDLALPEFVQDQWWFDSMVVVRVVK